LAPAPLHPVSDAVGDATQEPVHTLWPGDEQGIASTQTVVSPGARRRAVCVPAAVALRSSKSRLFHSQVDRILRQLRPESLVT
jgi:hypothetical protein